MLLNHKSLKTALITIIRNRHANDYYRVNTFCSRTHFEARVRQRAVIGYRTQTSKTLQGSSIYNSADTDKLCIMLWGSSFFQPLQAASGNYRKLESYGSDGPISAGYHLAGSSATSFPNMLHHSSRQVVVSCKSSNGQGQ